MRYEVTPDLETGNALIDREHRELFSAINRLLDACSQGQGRAVLKDTVTFLNDYVKKHFSDEEDLQKRSNYPGLAPHRQFHENYRRQLADVSRSIQAEGATIKAIGDLNQMAGVLISHIRREDKRLAAYLKEGH